MQHLELMNEKRDRYTKVRQVGEGTFGKVYEGIDSKSGLSIAIKKIKLANMEDGVNFSALREIKVLQELQDHPNILKLIDIFITKTSTINIVYEFMNTDLSEIIQDTSIFLTESNIKAYMQQIIMGVNECHKNWVLHRDLKPNNLLLTKSGVLKLADFGLAKVFGSPDRTYTPIAVTRWYRPPELLFGADTYGPSADMWSCGCIMAELFLRRAIFPGDNDLDQLGRIFFVMGTPTDEQWPGMKTLPGFLQFEKLPGTPLRSILTGASAEAIDFLTKLLQFDPSKRISAEQALKHPFFTGGVPATPLDQLPLPKKLRPETPGSVPTSDHKRRRSPDDREDRMNISTSSIDSMEHDDRSVRRKLVL